MRTWLRRVRGAIGMGFVWAAAWASVGFVPRWVLGMEGDLPFPLLFAGLGFIAGVAFSVILVLTQSRRRFDQMSLRRFAASGSVVGLVLGALFVRGTSLGVGEMLAIPATLAAACAACAAGSLAVARRAAARALTGDHAGAAEIGLAERARRALPRGGD